jgi:serine/threonine-protein kinase
MALELDDLRQALRKLEPQLERDRALNLRLHGALKQDRMRATLRPLFWAHAAQVALGVLMVLPVGRFWVQHLHEPHLLVAGLVVHAYAVAMIALGARMLVLLHGLDFAAPVVAIQKQVARVRRSYVRSGLVVGLPWWLLWLPFAMLVFGMLGFDLYANFSRAWFFSNVAFGAVGIVVTLWLTRSLWYRTSATDRDAKVEAAAGSAFRNVQRFLDEIARFEKE